MKSLTGCKIKIRCLYGALFFLLILYIDTRYSFFCKNITTTIKNTIKITKAELSTANALLNKVAALDITEDEDEDETAQEQARDSKKPVKVNRGGSEETRNILQSL